MLKDFKLSYKRLNNNIINYRESEMFILLSLLHINGFISNKSLFSQFTRLKKGKLIRTIHTYHSKINDRWYNEESINDIYIHILEDMINPNFGNAKLRLERINKLRFLKGLPPKFYKKELNFEETLLYLNKYLNKNRNFCIDHLYHTYIKPNIYNYEYYGGYLEHMFNYDFRDLKNKYINRHSNYDYCCEYCCGTYEDWTRYNQDRISEESNKYISEEILKLINIFLNSKRTYYKNNYKEFTL